MSFSDFLNAPLPEPTVLPEAQTTGARRFFNRELSWLAFNWRVLEEAENPRVPLLERMRFVSISAGNLDEFYTVRVAGLRELALEGNIGTSDDGRTAAEQLTLINADARRLMQHQQAAWIGIRKELEREGITVVSRSALKAADRKYLEEEFLARVFPVLSPLAIDPAHPFPFIPNEGLALALQMRRARDGRELAGAFADPQPDRPLRAPARDGRQRALPAAGRASPSECRRALSGL
jgi:polyphosphate kinase